MVFCCFLGFRLLGLRLEARFPVRGHRFEAFLKLMSVWGLGVGVDFLFGFQGFRVSPSAFRFDDGSHSNISGSGFTGFRVHVYAGVQASKFRLSLQPLCPAARCFFPKLQP